MIDDHQYSPAVVTEQEWATDKCDKYDYVIAASCGAIAGLIDVFFVGDPLSSTIGNSVDKATDDFVKKAAQFFWKNDKRTTGKSRHMPESLEQCISYLEQAFPVNYDARYAKELKVPDGVLSGMRPVNHHLLSLAHSPDPIGLIVSIIDQFSGYGTFIDKGRIINAVPQKTSGAIPYLQGHDFPSMLFCGFVNWIGHLISDIAGSSSTRAVGKSGRGAGIPMPFYELFLKCDFKGLDGNTVADTMIKVFEQGYDLRHGLAMSIPVLFEELSIRVIWMIRQKFFKKKSWKESIPSDKHADLRIMLIIGNGTLCAVDGIDAAARGFASQNLIVFICHLNFIGWARFVILVSKELEIRYGSVIDSALQKFVNKVLNSATPLEKVRIQSLLKRLAQYDARLNQVFKEFVGQIEKEYEELYAEIGATFDGSKTVAEQAEHSVRLAEVSGVQSTRIVHSHSELDDLFS